MNDQELFKKTYKKYYNRVYHYIKGRIVEYEYLDELTDDVFLKLNIYYPHIPEYEIDGRIKNITKTTIIDHYRKMKDARGRVMESFDNLMVNSNWELSKHIDEKNILEKIEKCLSNKEKYIYDLFFKKNLMYRDIANESGMNINTIKITIFRMRSKIISKYKNDYIKVIY